MFSSAKSTLGKTAEAISQQADGLQNAVSAYAAPTTSGYKDYDEPHSVVSRMIAGIKHQLATGLPMIDLGTIHGIIDLLRHTNEMDDRKFLLENALILLSRLPDGSLKTKFQNAVVELFYHDLAHPPNTYLGKQHSWRTPDGSYNNINLPNTGKAGNNYSRSVQQKHPLPESQLPDPGLLFDALLKREKSTEHPGGLSAMMFSFAVLVVHTVFRTDHSDWSVNLTSSYVDLAPLYGWSLETQMRVRNVDGRGYMKRDVFAEDRMLFLPPAASVVLVLLNRNHNYIAERLMAHNERGTFVHPSTLTEEQMKAQDDELFNVARLINCTWFGNIVFSDYFSAILGLCRFGSSWFLNPFEEIRKGDHTFVERGQGNAVTVEFNLLYRWHATLSEMDQKWIENVFDKAFNGKDYHDVSMQDLGQAMAGMKKNHGTDVTTWTFGGVTRDDSGGFKDSDLAKILLDAIEEPANAFGARNTPGVLRIVEIMTIKQARTWGVCNMNEFRKYLGLKPFKTFEEWNSNPTIASTARRLYGDIENLELHVGLQAEEAKPVIPGAGLCPGYTVSRAILADAIALTRGDRFFTTDLTPFNLTTWGFADCNRDGGNPAFGGMLGRLFLRTLPDHFTHNNVYTWFPLMTPGSMQKHLTSLSLAQNYSFERPKTKTPRVSVSRHAHVVGALKSEAFGHTYAERAASLALGQGFFIASPDLAKAKAVHQNVSSVLIGSADALKKHSDEMVKLTGELIKERSFTVVGDNTLSVDIIRDVLGVMPLHWVAKVTGLDLKTAHNPHGSYVEVELQQMFQKIYGFLFFEGEAAHQMQFEGLARQHTNQLLKSIKASSGHGVTKTATTNASSVPSSPKMESRKSIFNLFTGGSAKSKNSTGDGPVKMADNGVTIDKSQHALYDSGYSKEEVPDILFAVAVGCSSEYSQALIHVVNFYLSDEYKAEKDMVVTLATSSSESANEMLEGYVREALRLDPPIPGVHRVCNADLVSGGAAFNAGQRYYLSIANANMDDSVFPNPTKVDPRRPKDTYLIGDTALRCLGEDFIFKPIAQVIKTIFALPNVRRGPGLSGLLNRSAVQEFDTTQYEYIDMKQRLTLWAQSMIIQYDGPAATGLPAVELLSLKPI